MLDAIAYHRSMDAIARMGVRAYPAEAGGYVIGDVRDGLAMPSRFVRSANVETRRSRNRPLTNAYNTYTPKIPPHEMEGMIGSVHTHPCVPAWLWHNMNMPTTLAGPSPGDIQYWIGHDIPLAIIAVPVPETDYAYLKAWNPSFELIGPLEALCLPIVFGGKEYAGMLYLFDSRGKVFVESNAEADEIILPHIRYRNKNANI